MILRVKVTPNASRSEILGWEEHSTTGRHLRVRLQAPPVDGKANKAVIAFFAKALKIPKSAVTLRSGLQSRMKKIVLIGVNEKQVRGLIE